MKYDEEKIYDKIKRKKIIKNILKYILYVILIITFLINFILLYQNIFQKDGKKKLFNIYMFNIISGSMNPKLNENDIIFVKECNNGELNIGDVITFFKEDEIITHRIVNIIGEGEKKNYITKGDNNEIEDDFIVKEEEIYGKMLLSIPKIGLIAQYIQNTNGFINLTIIILTIFIFISLNDKKKNIRRTKRRKYEIKRLRDNYN